MVNKEGGYLHTTANTWGKLPKALMHNKSITDGAKVLYAHMHWRYGSNGQNYEGQASMADMLGVSVATIENRISELVQHDWIVVLQRTANQRRITNFYHIFEDPAKCRAWCTKHRYTKPAPRKRNQKPLIRQTRKNIGGKPTHKDEGVTQVRVAPKLELGANLDSGIQHKPSSFTNVQEDGYAQPSQAQVDASTALNASEKEILRACNDGVVIAHLHNAEAALHLIELGMIEMCKCGAKDVLCLKGKCPEHKSHAGCDDPKVSEMQQQLALLSSQSGGEPVKPVIPSPQTPSPLPEVPEGYNGIFRAMADGSLRHYVKPSGKMTACGFRLSGIRFTSAPSSEPVRQCVNCAAKTAARAQGKGKAKAKKPAVYSDQHLFDLIAAFMNITGEAEIRANAPQIGKARKALCDYILDKLKREPTADELPKIYERLEAVGPWYDKSCKGCDRPGWDKVTKWYIKYVQSLNGTAQAEGDSTWFDSAKGAYLKREKGVLYEQDPMNGEKWIPAK